VSDTIADLKVRVELENAQIKSQIEAIETKFKELGSTVKAQESKVNGLGEVTKKLGGIMAGIASIGFLKKAGEEAIQNVKSQELLQRQMEKTTGASQEQVNTVIAQIDALEKMSNVQAEELRPQFDTLLRSTHNATRAMDLLNLALDVSAGTGKDVSTVTMALSKSINGSQVALNRVAPEVKNVKDKLGYLKDEFKGASQAAADKDPYGKLEITMKNLYEAVGMTLLPVLQQLAGVFQTTADFIKPMLPVIEGIAAAFVTYKIGIMGLTAYQTIYNGVVALSTIATEGFTVALASTGIGAIAIAVGLLTAGLIALNGQMDSASKPRNATYTNPTTGQSTTLDLNEIHNQADAYAKTYARIQRERIYAALKREGYNTQVGRDGLLVDPLAGAELIKRYDYKTVYDKAFHDRYKYIADKQKAVTNAVVTTAITPTPTPADTKLADYLKATQKEILKLQNTYQTDMVQAQQNYADAVQGQIDDFRKSFADATNVNLGDLFANGAQSADQLVKALKDKLTSITQFSEDLGKLSATGYNAEFLKQVVAQGPVMGDQMAKALLGASPEAQKELQSLFASAQDATAHGVDDLSLSIADQFNVSTKALSDAMLAAADKLNTALSELSVSFQSKTTEIGVKPNQASTVKMVAGKITGANVAGSPVYNITNYVTTNATAEQIANSTVQAIKYGQPTLAVQP